MGRMQRVFMPGYPLHIIHCGNNRLVVFFAERDFQLYLESLGYALKIYNCALHSYVLVTNHVHLLLTPSDVEGVSQLKISLSKEYYERDFQLYLESLGYALKIYNCALHSYVLVTNHVHLLLTPSDVEGVSQLMQSVGRRYVRNINNKYECTIILWNDRYNSSTIDSENYLPTFFRYIELNPVRLGMVS